MSLGKITERLFSLIMHLFLEHYFKGNVESVGFFTQDGNSKLLKKIFDVTCWSVVKHLNAWLSKNWFVLVFNAMKYLESCGAGKMWYV